VVAAAAPYVAVVGPSEATSVELERAEEVGQALAGAGAVVAGGLTVGILPGHDRSAANEWVSVAIATGLGELRNGLIVRAADALVAVGGAYGTLSEVALALKSGTPVIGLDTWPIEGIETVRSAGEAAARAIGSAPAG
jgi:uncharacterized protein (TIGR00725 family)